VTLLHAAADQKSRLARHIRLVAGGSATGSLPL